MHAYAGLEASLVAETGGGEFDWQVPAGIRSSIGGGIEYRLFDDLLLQTGVTYDSSPLKNKHRTAALPIDRQIVPGFTQEASQVRLSPPDRSPVSIYRSR